MHKHADGVCWVYAAFSNHGGENSVLKIGFTSDPGERFKTGTRDIFHRECDRFIGYVNGFPAGALEQAVLEFARRLGLRVPEERSPSSSTETIRFDPTALRSIFAAMPSGNPAVDRFLTKVAHRIGPLGDPAVRPVIDPGTVRAYQEVARRKREACDAGPPVDWGLFDRLDAEEVAFRPASRGARLATGLNPEDWHGLRRPDGV